MNCPACTRSLTEMKAGNVTVDICKGGCGGVWFDNFELQKVDEQHEKAGEVLLHIEKDPTVKLDLEARRTCPKDGGVIMMRHFFSVKRQVTVDHCPKCNGFWLDAGELSGIRTQYKTDDQRKAAAQTYFSSLYNEELKKMSAKGAEDKTRARKIASALRWISPTFWIPGDQDWGAF